MSDRPTFVYVTYIESTAEKVWHALTDAVLTAAYWGHSNVSDWPVGSSWEHRRTDGTRTADVVGTVVESAAPTRLLSTWADPCEERADGPSRVTFDIEPYAEIVRLTVTHEDLSGVADRDECAGGRRCCPTSRPSSRPDTSSHRHHGRCRSGDDHAADGAARVRRQLSSRIPPPWRLRGVLTAPRRWRVILS